MIGVTKVKAAKEAIFKNTIWMKVEIHIQWRRWKILNAFVILFQSWIWPFYYVRYLRS